VKPTDIVRDLGVLLDSELTMKRHVSKTVSTCFYHLRQLQCHVDIDTMKQLVSAFIFSRLDYCNAVLYGLPQSTIGPLQRVQNAATRVTLGLSPRDHVYPALKELHWLPVAHRIQYKVALLMFMVHDNHCPMCLSESVHPVSSNPIRQRLRSATSLDYIVPWTKTKFRDRAFSVAGPTVWNSLPESVRSVETLSSFKQKLKTYLFNILF